MEEERLCDSGRQVRGEGRWLVESWEWFREWASVNVEGEEGEDSGSCASSLALSVLPGCGIVGSRNTRSLFSCFDFCLEPELVDR